MPNVRLIDYHEADFDVMYISLTVKANGTSQSSFERITTGEIVKEAVVRAGVTAPTSAREAGDVFEAAEVAETVTERAAHGRWGSGHVRAAGQSERTAGKHGHRLSKHE